MAVRTAYDPTAGEILTATNLEKLAGGWIGHAEVTADQGTFTAETDITGLSVAVTVGPSRRIKVSAFTSSLKSSVANDYLALTLKEGATQLTTGAVTVTNGTNGVTASVSVVLTPSTGAHTYKVAAARAAGTGNVTYGASATAPGYILVEDLGPAA